MNDLELNSKWGPWYSQNLEIFSAVMSLGIQSKKFTKNQVLASGIHTYERSKYEQKRSF